jgi:rare lipoprotein A (peptidoglycan hydrolase)
VALILGLCCVCGAGALYLHKRGSRPTSPPDKRESSADSSQPSRAKHPEPRSREGYASWYDVPVDSLAHRRGGEHEFTAANDKLPLGTLLRVTHLENGKSVIVRITDRGIHNRRVQLDLCKEAADELDMISKGIARVRMEIIPEASGSSPPEAHTSAPVP